MSVQDADLDEEIEDDIDVEDDDDALDEDSGLGDEDDEGEPSEVEALALEAGWKPKSQWKGEGWTDAATYLKSAANRAKSAKRDARDLTDRMDTLEATHRVSLDRQSESLRAQAKIMRDAAIAKGGKDAVEEVEAIDKVLAEELDKLDKQTKGDAPELTALDKAYLSQHAWMLDDESFSDADAKEADEAFELYSATLASVLKKTGDANEAHERADRAIRKAFAHRYEDEEDEPRRRAPSRRTPDLARGHQSGGGRGGASRLPPEALKAAQDCVKRGIYGSIEEYAEVYEGEKKKGRRA